MKLPRRATELLGWYGVLAILTAYALNNLRLLGVDSVAYQLLNITGSLGIIADSWPDRNWQPISLNTVWIAVALIALLRLA